MNRKDTFEDIFVPQTATTKEKTHIKWSMDGGETAKLDIVIGKKR